MTGALRPRAAICRNTRDGVVGAPPIRGALQTGYARRRCRLAGTGGNLGAGQTARTILRVTSAYVFLPDGFAILAPCRRWCQAISIGAALPWRGDRICELPGLALRSLALRNALCIRCVRLANGCRASSSTLIWRERHAYVRPRRLLILSSILSGAFQCGLSTLR